MICCHHCTNNVMEMYNRDFNNLFDLSTPGLYVFCESILEEAHKWEKRHEDARKGTFISCQRRKQVEWLDIPLDFLGWEPKKKRAREQKWLFFWNNMTNMY